MNATAMAFGTLLAGREGLAKDRAFRVGLLAGLLGVGTVPATLLSVVMARREIAAAPPPPSPPAPVLPAKAALPDLGQDEEKLHTEVALPRMRESGDGHSSSATLSA
jgi:hypothetical protein